MPSSYSTNLKIELQATGENSGTWGTITNTNLGTALEQAIVGYGNPSYSSDANLTLTYTDTNAAQAARALVLNVTSAVSLSATRELVVPTIQKQYIVQNNTTGSQSITVKTSGGTGITVPNGRKAHLYVNGTDVIYMDDYVDINGGAIDGTTIGANSAAAGTFTTVGATTGNITTVNATTVDTTNVEVTNVKAKDGTAAIAIADSTGAVTVSSSSVLNGGVVINEPGADVDFRVESDTDANCLFVDASANNVGIGTSSPSSKLTVQGIIRTTDGTNYSLLDNNYLRSYASGTFYFDNATTGQSFVWRMSSSSALDTTALTLTSSGNLGLGVTPSAWSAYRAFQMQAGSLLSFSTTDFRLVQNVVRTGTTLDYLNNGRANMYLMDGSTGGHIWYTAPSGTAGNTISFTQAMTLDASGNLGIGTSSPTAKLKVVASSATYINPQVMIGEDSDATGKQLHIGYNTTANTGYIQAVHNGTGYKDLIINPNGGNLGLGVTPSAWNTYKALEIGRVGNYFAGYSGGTELTLGANAYYSTGWKYAVTGASATRYMTDNSGGHYWYTAPSGTAGNAITFTQAMTLDASGNLGVGTSSPSVRLHVASSTSDPVLIKNTGSGAYNSLILESDNGKKAVIGVGGSTVGGSLQDAIYVGAITNSPLLFNTNNAERARITSGGYFKASNAGTYFGSTGAYHELRQTADDAGVQISSTAATLNNTVLTVRASQNTTNGTFHYIDCYNDGSGTYRLRIADSGNVTNTNGSYGTISDAKMKTDIVDAGSQWADLKAIRFRKFKMKDDPSGLMQLGVVAQELEQTSPGLVEEHPDRDAEGNDLGTTTKSVKTSVLLMKAAVALQEAMARIEKLEAEVAALKGA